MLCMKKLKLPEFEFQTEIPVLIEHINYAGHLGNDSMLSILHEARMRFLHSRGLTESNRTFGLLMVESHIQYISESFYGDILRVYVQASKPKRSFCSFFYLLINASKQKEAARACTTLAFFNHQKQKMAIPPQGLQSLNP